MSDMSKYYKYVLDLSAYISAEEKILSLNPQFSELTADPRGALICSMYEDVRKQMPTYFFRKPTTFADCHCSMTDALQVLEEDEKILMQWNNALDNELAALKNQQQDL